MAGFLKDAMDGRLFEEYVKQSLNGLFNLQLRKNTDPHGIDLLKARKAVEVKYDRQMEDTGNIFIEFAYNYKKDGWGDSGILKYDFPIWFAFGNYRKYWVVVGTKDELREKVELWKKEFRVINCGDGYRSKGVLIPLTELDRISHFAIHLNEVPPNPDELAQFYAIRNHLGGRPKKNDNRVVYSVNNRKPKKFK